MTLNINKHCFWEVQVEGLLTIAGDETGKLGWSHIVNDLNVLAKLLKILKQRHFQIYFRGFIFLITEFEGGIEAEAKYLGYSIPIWMSNDKDKVHVSGNSNGKYGRYITMVNKTGSAP